IAPTRTAVHPHAHDLACARIIRNPEAGVILNHRYLLPRPSQHPGDAPPLSLAQRAGLRDDHPVAHVRLSGAVVGLEPPAVPDDLLVERMSPRGLDLHDDGFLHLVADDDTDAGLPRRARLTGSCHQAFPPLPTSPGAPHAGRLRSADCRR